MRALVLERNGLDGVHLRDVPDPEPRGDEILARVLACGLGGTVLRKVRSVHQELLPRILGHEAVLEVVAVGDDVDGFSVGDKAVPYYYLTCGECLYCSTDRRTLCTNHGRGERRIGEHLDGALADYILVPARSLIPVSPDVDPIAMTVAIDAVATPVHVSRRAGAMPGERIAVIGAGGGVGSHLVQVAAHLGLSVIAVDRPEKLQSLADLIRYDFEAQDPNDAGGLSQKHASVDVVVDFVGSKGTIEMATGLLGRGGRLVLLTVDTSTSVTMNGVQLVGSERSVLGSKYCTPEEVRKAIDLVSSGAVRPVITDSGRLEDAPRMLERIARGKTVGRSVVNFA